MLRASLIVQHGPEVGKGLFTLHPFGGAAGVTAFPANVIGGQLISKSQRGTTTYFPEVFEKEGILTALVIFVVPFLLIRLFDRLFPFFPAAPTTSDLQGAKP